MTNTSRHIARVCAAAILIMICAADTRAGTLEPSGINLGLTSFFDGFGGTEPGFAYLGYYTFEHLDHIVDANGNDSPAFKNPNIDVFLMLNQLVYTTPVTLFDGNAHLGFTGLLPLLGYNTSFDQSSPVKLTSINGFGDLTLGAFLQFNPLKSGGRPVFSHRFEFDVIAPIGRYSATDNITPSAHFWSIAPYWAATWLPTPKLELSVRLNYLYNFANNDPQGVSSTVTSTQAGQAAWANFTASYEVLPKFNLGINGYYFKQFTNDTFDYADGTTDNGLAFGDSGKAMLLAIGPGAFWHVGKEDFLHFNVYFQADATNDARGAVFNIHWIHAF